jgi:integrase/recombinase XerD
MFERFSKVPHRVARFQNGPLAEERRSYLEHLTNEGRGFSRLSAINAQLLSIAEMIGPSLGKQYTSAELHDFANQCFARLRFPTVNTHREHIWKTEFHFLASSWLRFLDRFETPPDDTPYANQIEEFIHYLAHERGFADATCGNRRRSLRPFFTWLSARGVSLGTVSPADISAYFTAATGRWLRTTVSQHVQSLRSFFRYAGSRGWCADGIAKTIDAPRLYTHENLPQGPSWNDVQRLLESTSGNSILQIRQRATFLLLAVYGLRAGEVCQLRLDDIDWVQEKIRLRRPKQRKSQDYPLTTEIGNALSRYIEIRPKSRRREVFLTLRQQYRPLSVGGFSSLVQKRQKQLGLELKRFGPHGLRHACATHLLAEGFSLKEVGDHLGHVSAAATRVYAKVDLNGLREVATVDVSGLVVFLSQCEKSEELLHTVGEIALLREVARFSLEELV